MSDTDDVVVRLDDVSLTSMEDVLDAAEHIVEIGRRQPPPDPAQLTRTLAELAMMTIAANVYLTCRHNGHEIEAAREATADALTQVSKRAFVRGVGVCVEAASETGETVH